MSYAYTEDQLVEHPVILLFLEQSALPNLRPHLLSHWGKGLRQAGLKVRSLVVLVGRLRTILQNVSASRMDHDALPPEAIDTAMDELIRDRSVRSPYLIGWRMTGVAPEFPTSSLSGRKRPA